MRNMRARFLLVVALSVTLAVFAMFLIIPHRPAGHVHPLGERHTVMTEGTCGNMRLHPAYEAPTDDLTRLRMHLGNLPHLTKVGKTTIEKGYGNVK